MPKIIINYEVDKEVAITDIQLHVETTETINTEEVWQALHQTIIKFNNLTHTLKTNSNEQN